MKLWHNAIKLQYSKTRQSTSQFSESLIWLNISHTNYIQTTVICVHCRQSLCLLLTLKSCDSQEENGQHWFPSEWGILRTLSNSNPQYDIFKNQLCTHFWPRYVDLDVVLQYCFQGWRIDINLNENTSKMEMRAF